MPIDAFESNQTEHHLLHSFCIHPNERFEAQHSNEEVVLRVRAHPITFIPWITTASVLFVVPIFANVFLVDLFTITEILFMNLFWYSLIFSYVFLNVLRWVFNVGIVTNERVIDIDYKQILQKDDTSTTLEDVTDATARTTGFIRSLFRYGDVFIQTAGREQNIIFHSVPYPSSVSSIINRLM